MRFLVLALSIFLVGCHAVEPRWHDLIAADDRPKIRVDEFENFESSSDVAWSFQPPFPPEVAFEILLKTRVFARVITGGPSLSGRNEASRQSVAFGVLHKEADAREIEPISPDSCMDSADFISLIDKNLRNGFRDTRRTKRESTSHQGTPFFGSP